MVYEKKDILHSEDVILSNLKNPIYKAYLLFLQYILDIVNQMNLQFQSESTQIHVLFSKFTSLYKTILKNFIKKSVLDSLKLSKITPSNPDYFIDIENVYIGANASLFLSATEFESVELKKFRTNILSFYVELATQIRQRFDFDNEFLQFLTNFQPQNIINNSVMSIMDSSKYFSESIVENLQSLDNEWRMLCEIDELKKIDKISFDDFWLKVMNMTNEIDEEMFPNLNKLIRVIICLPHSSATAERVFSKLNLIKTDLRNRLDVKTCNSILLSTALLKGESCFTWQPSEKLLKRKINYD